MAWFFVLAQRLLPQHLLSRVVGKLANARTGWLRQPLIRLFIAAFGVDLDEAARSSPADFDNFNDFFTRHLKPGTRPVSGDIASPADGTVSMAGQLDDNQLVQAKGLHYSLEKLLAGPEAARYRNGSYLTVYLSPRDYHRVHVPMSAGLTATTYVPGKLFSVNAATTRLVTDLFAANERLVAHFDTSLGPMAMVMVGAMIVAGIRTVWRDGRYPPGEAIHETFDPPRMFEQGAEFGHFEMGSTVILVFERRISWQVAAGTQLRMGAAVGASLPPPVTDLETTATE